jgi:hypothetical protein
LRFIKAPNPSSGGRFFVSGAGSFLLGKSFGGRGGLGGEAGAAAVLGFGFGFSYLSKKVPVDLIALNSGRLRPLPSSPIVFISYLLYAYFL